MEGLRDAVVGYVFNSRPDARGYVHTQKYPDSSMQIIDWRLFVIVMMAAVVSWDEYVPTCHHPQSTRIKDTQDGRDACTVAMLSALRFNILTGGKKD